MLLATEAELAKLGKPGSRATARLLPALPRPPKGPMIGQPFELEPWQRISCASFTGEKAGPAHLPGRAARYSARKRKDSACGRTGAA